MSAQERNQSGERRLLAEHGGVPSVSMALKPEDTSCYKRMERTDSADPA